MADAEGLVGSAPVDLSDGFQLGEITVWPRRDLLVAGGGEERHLEPKVMQVLVELARNARSPVSRDDLLQRVWSDAVVGDEVLSRAISLLRSSLGDDRADPTFIRTIPRQGYELIIEATSIASSQSGRPWVWGAAVSLVFLLVVAAIYLQTGDERPRLAILALATENLELGPTAERIGDEIIAIASSSDSIDTVAKRSTFAFRDPSIQIEAVASALDATHILDGALTQNGGGWSATITLTETVDEQVVWSRQFDASSETALTAAIANGVGAALDEALSANVRQKSASTVRVNENAYRTYLAARHQWSLRGDRRIQQSIALLEEAIASAPEFAEAHLALAQSHAIEPFYSAKPVLAQFDLAREALSRAVDLDPGLREEADTLEAFMTFRQRDWEAAETLFLRVLTADPRSVLANYWYSMLLAGRGDYAGALERARAAVELDPLSSVLNDRLAVSYLWVDDLDAAARYFELAADLGYAQATRSKAYMLFLIRSARFDELYDALAALGLQDEWVRGFVRAMRDPAARSEAVALSETEVAAGRLPRELQFGVWVLLDERDRAFAAFDKGLKTLDVEFLWAPETAFLTKDARFHSLLAELALPGPQQE